MNHSGMLFREDHHSCRVAKLMFFFPFCQIADTMVNNQPTMLCKNRRSASTYFEPFPGRHGSCQPMVRIKQTKLVRFKAIQGYRAVRNPDTFMIQIKQPFLAHTCSFFRSGTGEKRSVQNSHLHFSGMIGNGNREKTGILVVYM